MNGSRHGIGKYASPDEVRRYCDAMESYLKKRCQEWLDRWQDKKTGEFPPGIKDLCRVWQLDGHIAKWLVSNGWLHPESIPEGGIKNNQIGRLTAIAYCGSHEGRKAVAFEAKRYIDELECKQIEEMRSKRTDPFVDMADRVFGGIELIEEER